MRVHSILFRCMRYQSYNCQTVLVCLLGLGLVHLVEKTGRCVTAILSLEQQNKIGTRARSRSSSMVKLSNNINMYHRMSGIIEGPFLKKKICVNNMVMRNGDDVAKSRSTLMRRVNVWLLCAIQQQYPAQSVQQQSTAEPHSQKHAEHQQPQAL